MSVLVMQNNEYKRVYKSSYRTKVFYAMVVLETFDKIYEKIRDLSYI